MNVIYLMLFFSASIFAYGQTSSGKTYTMVGITEYTVSDIYDYINKVMNSIFVSSFISSSSLLKPFSQKICCYYSMKREHLC